MPLTPTDGEFWCGYGRFDEAIKVLDTSNLEFWNQVKYVIYDACNEHHLKYDERMDLLKDTIPKDHANLQLNLGVTCEGKEHLQRFLKEVEARGGEGVILRRNQCFYHDPNTFYLFKVSLFFQIMY